MAKLSFDQLGKSLGSKLSPVYLVSGDEPLLVQEACDAIRGAAKKQGFSERELFHADPHFHWTNLLHSANSMSLFADRKILEVRIPNGKPGDAGSKVIQEYCHAPADDNLLLLVCPKLDKSTQNSKWYKSIEAIGVTVAIWPISAKQLPRWIDQRLQKAGIRADSRAVEILASRVEGNLLAAVQEIEKLKLVAEDGIIDHHTMANAVVDSARYDVFGLVDKALIGNPHAAATTLNGLRGEGSEPTIILWAIVREIRALIAIKQAMSDGQNIDYVAKRNGVFDNRLTIVRAALQRLSMPTLRLLLKESAYADRTIKGMASGDPWGVLLDIIMTLAGTRALSGKVLSTLLK